MKPEDRIRNKNKSSKAGGGRNANKRKIIFLITALVLIAALLLMLPSSLERYRSHKAGSSVASSETGENGGADGNRSVQDDSGEGQGSAAAGSSGASGAPYSIGTAPDGSAPLVTIFCASDYQAETGWNSPADNLTGILDSTVTGLKEARSQSAEAGSDSGDLDKEAKVKSSGNDDSGEGSENKGSGAETSVIDSAIFCGDYSNDPNLYNHQISPDEAIEEIKSILISGAPGISSDDMIFVQGNHDALSDQISASGLHEYDDYLVYVLNTQEDFPWRQGKTAGSLNKVKASSAALKECMDKLISKGETRPVMIAGHVPLHFTARTSSRHTTGDNLYSSLIFDVVNEAAESLDIIYLYGHNHSKGWDCYLGGSSVFRKAGDSILIPEFDSSDVNTDEYNKETLNFTYLNAGYVGYYMNCGPEEAENGTWQEYAAADGDLTSTILEIYPDCVVISRWDKEGVHQISGEGEGDPYKGGTDAGLIPESEYGKAAESPQTIPRKNST